MARTFLNAIVGISLLNPFIVNGANYQECSVESVNFNADGSYSAALACIAGASFAWRVNKIKPIAYECADDEVKATQVEEKRREMQSLAGMCLPHLNIEAVQVKNVEAQLSFFYMALKDAVVLKSISVADDGKLTAAELARGFRPRERADEMIELGGLINSSPEVAASRPEMGSLGDGMKMKIAMDEKTKKYVNAPPPCSVLLKDLEYNLALFASEKKSCDEKGSVDASGVRKSMDPQKAE